MDIEQAIETIYTGLVSEESVPVKLRAFRELDREMPVSYTHLGGRQIDYNAYIKRLETIDMEYENIRIDTTDISKIAQNTGMPEWKISRIKDHVFSNEHILDAGVKRLSLIHISSLTRGRWQWIL